MMQSARRVGSLALIISCVSFRTMLLVSFPSAALAQNVRLNKPADAAIANEVVAVQATYEREMIKAANDEAAAIALVEDLIGQVPATLDSAGKWALLQVAQDVAERDSGNIDVALKCVLVRASLFEIDSIKERLAVLKNFSEPKVPANPSLFEQAMQAAREALAVEKYVEAKQAAAIATDVAAVLNRTERDEVSKIVRNSKGQIRPPRRAEEQYVAPARQIVGRIDQARSITAANELAQHLLKANPNDGEAKADVGEYECFIKGAWDTGLHLIAAVRTTPVAEVARAEISARDPFDAAKLFNVADRWWAVAKDDFSDSPLKSDAVRAHAADIYSTVLPTLTKPTEVKRANDRIAEGKGTLSPQRILAQATSVVYLSDMQEDGSKVVHFGFGKGTINGNDNPIRSIIDGKESPHGLSMHPGDGPNGQCFVKYTLPKGARRLSAIVTLDEGGGFDHCGIGFEVVADGRVAWKSKTINKDHRFEICEVDITDCRNLELRTYTVTSAFGGHAVWIEPRIHVDRRIWPADEVDFVANREAAEWVLQLNGELEIELANKKRLQPSRIADLPRDEFAVVSINLSSRPGVTDQGLAMLSKLRRLEHLAVSATPVTDAFFEHIRDLSMLRVLGVSWTQVSGKGLATLTNSKIVGLEIGGMADPEAAVAHIHKQGVAEWVNFDGMKLSPESVRLLGELKTLKDLTFGAGLLAPSDLETLRKQLPGCNVRYHD
jgi:hypothetical protein